MKKFLILVLITTLLTNSNSFAQEVLPYDNGPFSYHPSPNYRESESHPFRIAAYILHPIGWLLREGITRPISYGISSNATTKSLFGYREPYDYRKAECFSSSSAIPNCHEVAPYKTGTINCSNGQCGKMGHNKANISQQFYFPDVNFDFNKSYLNDLGKGQVRQIAELLKSNPNMKIVLQGNTDYIGDDEYNIKLGLDRAEAVKAELVSLGVSLSALSTVTFGSGNPVFEDKENWARAVSRRVEVTTE